MQWMEIEAYVMRVVSEEARVRDVDVVAGSGGSWLVVHTNSFRIICTLKKRIIL